LRELPLSEKEIAAVAPQLAGSLLRLRGGRMTADSALFDFCGKVTAVVEHFAPDGLTLQDYLGAAVRQPTLLGLKPATVIRHADAVAAHFQKHGLTLPAYLRAACRQPQLFYQSPSTIQGNIEQVASHFREHGLTLKDYLRAAVRQPTLFCL